MAKKILIVDDEPDILRAAQVRLISFGYEVITKTDGKDIMGFVKTSMPDLILLDLRLPVMGGDEICLRLKKDDALKKIPVIMFTASTDIRMSNKIKEIGANGYLIKPFTPEELMQAVKKFAD